MYIFQLIAVPDYEEIYTPIYLYIAQVMMMILIVFSIVAQKEKKITCVHVYIAQVII